MKKWLKFFGLSFFSNEISKDGIKRGYANFFLGLILALIFLFAGVIGADVMPFGVHYNRAPDFRDTARTVFANENVDKRLSVLIEGDTLKAKLSGGNFENALLIDTFNNPTDKLNYSVNGYNVVVDTRPADTLAEFNAYCVAKDDNTNVISYEDYLTLNNIARLNFDFKLEYTGRALYLDDTFVADCKTFVDGTSDENKQATEKLANDLLENKITKEQYNKGIYELYFTNYYPSITAYESVSKVPLLRNYYYHKYINNGTDKYLLVFDDYMAGSFETKGGINVFFYGFYNNVKDGVLVDNGLATEDAVKLADALVKDSFKSTVTLSVYIYIMNILRVLPFIALMPIVVGLLVHSILKLKGVESCKTFGATFKVVGSYVWFSAVIAAVLTMILAFFVQRSVLNVLPLVLFFITLAVRSVIFALEEIKAHKKLIASIEEEEETDTESDQI